MEGVSVLSRGQGTKLGWTVFTIWPGVWEDTRSWSTGGFVCIGRCYLLACPGYEVGSNLCAILLYFRKESAVLIVWPMLLWWLKLNWFLSLNVTQWEQSIILDTHSPCRLSTVSGTPGILQDMSRNHPEIFLAGLHTNKVRHLVRSTYRIGQILKH